MLQVVFETSKGWCMICLIFKGKSFHKYGPFIFSDFFLLLDHNCNKFFNISSHNRSYAAAYNFGYG